MEFNNFSPTVILLIDGEEKTFSKYPSVDKPLPEDCRGKITGVKLAYAACGEQDYGMYQLSRDFNLTKYGVITKIPSTLEYINNDGVTAIRYGDICYIDHRIVNAAKECGILGYWDNNNLFICASEEYKFLVLEIMGIIIPQKSMLAFSESLVGNDLCIIATE